ncbi:MAG: hypothetical protein RIQ52_1664 [Pseudomonadota bacterium]
MSSEVQTLPWLASAWQQWRRTLASGATPQAMLLVGPEGLGKSVLAQQMAHGLLCEQPVDDRACGHCAACRRVQAGSHPDLLAVSPLENARHIVVDQLRSLIASLALRPQYGQGRVVLITPADSMNIQASNCLLKTLEEPDDDTTFLLVSSHPQRIPVTVISRCQRLVVAAPSRTVSVDWLLAQGVAQEHIDARLAITGLAPWRALQVDESALAYRRNVISQALQLMRHTTDPLAVAEIWSKEDMSPLVILQSLVCDMIRFDLHRQAPLTNEDIRTDLAPGSGSSTEALFRLLDAFPGWSRSLEGQANRQLLMEDCALHFYRCSMEQDLC